MCIIVSKPSGVAMPERETLKTCWKNNHDGAGFAYCRAGSNTVHIVKGFMKFSKLYKSLLWHDFRPEDQVVMHFRWATHGLTDSGNCHPFPLSNKTSELRSTILQTNIAIAHNGVFGGMPDHKLLSDTQKFVALILANKSVIDNLENPAVQELLRGYCGSSSKLAIIRPSGILHIGDFVEDGGIYYSNHQYKPYTAPAIYTGWQGHTCYDSDDYVDDSQVDDKDIPPSESDDISLMRGLNGYDHFCCLCGTHKDVAYCDDADGYLCDDCYELNFSRNRV